MRDQLAIEALGVPAVLLVTGVLVEMARSTARRFGLPGLGIVETTGLLYGLSRERIAEAAAPVAPGVAAALLG